jgi:hypothetical protein
MLTKTKGVFSVADPGSSAFLTPGSVIESLEFIRLKILKFFDEDPGWKNSDPG